MSLRKKIAFNTFIQFVNRFAIAGSAFLVSLLIARYFGARGFGEYSKATNFIALFYLLADFGFNAVVLRDINNRPNEEKSIINNLFGLRMIGGFALICIAILITFFLPYDVVRNEGFTPVAKGAIISLSLMILYQAFLNTANVVFQKHLRYEQSTLANIAASVVTLLTAVVLLSLGKSLPVILLSYVVGAIAASFILFIFVKKLHAQFAPRFSLIESKRLIVKALPLGLTLVFNIVYFRADVFILTLFRTTTEVGTYGLAYKFFEFPLTIPTFFANSLYPILLVHSQNKKQFQSTVTKAGLVLLGLSLIILVGIYITAPLLVYIRKDFFPSIAVLRLLSLSMPVFFLSSLFMWILITYGKNKQLLTVYFIGMIINILLNLLFVPLYGITAAAVITFVTELIILLASGYLAIRLVMVR